MAYGEFSDKKNREKKQRQNLHPGSCQKGLGVYLLIYPLYNKHCKHHHKC